MLLFTPSLHPNRPLDWGVLSMLMLIQCLLGKGAEVEGKYAYFWILVPAIHLC